MKVYFKNSKGKERIIGKASCKKGKAREKSTKIINDFLDSKNYKAPYWRITYHENNVHIDVGSWSEFFRIELAECEKYEVGNVEGTN